MCGISALARAGWARVRDPAQPGAAVPHSRSALVVLAAILALLALASCHPRAQARPAATPAPEAIRTFTAQEIRAALGDAPAGGYDVYAVRVGESAAAPKDLFYRGAAPGERAGIAYAFWVLVGGGRTVLVDTGFVSPAKIAEWKVTGYRNPVDGLAALGVRPEQVTDVIVTHRHWDHVGGLALFPKAQVWMPQPEYRDALERYATGDPAVHAALVAVAKDGRLRDPAPLERLFPGVTVVRQGAHTRAFQYVAVADPGGPLVLAGDAAPLYPNVTDVHASGQTRNAEHSAAAIAAMIELVGGRRERIVPGHDPEVFRRFPEVAPGVVKIAERRDVQ